MTQSLGLQTMTFMAAREPWAQFLALCRSRNISASATLRQMIAKELKRAQREIKTASNPELSGPAKLVKRSAK